MKNMKMKTKLILGFLIPIVLMLVNIILGDTTTKVAARISDPVAQERYIVNSAIFTAAIAVVAGVVTVILALMLIKTIEKSVKQLSDAAKEIALGHVDIELVKYNNDEFGNLVDEYIKVIDNIKYQARIAEEVSNGNLTMTVKPKSAEDLLGNSLKKLVEDNHSALSNISDAAQQVTVGSSQVASASQSLAQGTTEQASAIQQITSSIDEISAKTKQNAAQANEAADLVGDAIEDVKRGNAQMKDMMTAMQEINKSSESISKIIKVIDDIAFQTNILALNAAVEAARAGAAGKGFAVVADEVRNLAGKSAEAAKNTTVLIEGTVSAIERGRVLSDQVVDEMNLTESAAQVVLDINNDIAKNASSAAESITQISTSVEQISGVVQNNSATAEESAAASEELSGQSQILKELTARFQLYSED